MIEPGQVCVPDKCLLLQMPAGSSRSAAVICRWHGHLHHQQYCQCCPSCSPHICAVGVMTGSRLSIIKVPLASYLYILSKRSGVIQLQTNAISMEVMDHHKTKISTTLRSCLQWHTAAKLISATPFAWITFQWGQWSSPVLHHTSKLIWMLQ